MMYWLITYVCSRNLVHSTSNSYDYDAWQGSLLDWVKEYYGESRYLVNAIRITEKEYHKFWEDIYDVYK